MDQKIYAPIITHEVRMNNSHREPMAIIPVPESNAIMGVSMSAINGLLGSQMQARELLVWNDDGIGILDGCDLRFKINQHGLLEFLDSDDDEPATNQISPGSSLLKNGPNLRRPQKMNYKKIDNIQNSVLVNKLLPKELVKGKVNSWTTEEVKNFINSIPGCAGYGELFESQEICGESLLYLDQKDLLDVINVKLGPAVKIYHAISLLK